LLTVVDKYVCNGGIATQKQMEQNYSQEIANSPTTKNFFSAIQKVLKEYH